MPIVKAVLDARSAYQGQSPAQRSNLTSVEK
jgi:hypothetical protein